MLFHTRAATLWRKYKHQSHKLILWSWVGIKVYFPITSYFPQTKRSHGPPKSPFFIRLTPCIQLCLYISCHVDSACTHTHMIKHDAKVINYNGFEMCLASGIWWQEGGDWQVTGSRWCRVGREAAKTQHFAEDRRMPSDRLPGQ